MNQNDVNSARGDPFQSRCQPPGNLELKLALHCGKCFSDNRDAGVVTVDLQNQDASVGHNLHSNHTSQSTSVPRR